MAMLEKQNEMYLTNLQKEEERAQQGQAEREAMQEEVERVAAALEQTRSRELEWREKTQVLRAALTKSEMEKESLVKELAILQERVSERDTAEPCTQEESHAHCSQQLPELQEQAPTQELSARQDSNNFLLQQEEQCQEGQQNLDKLGEKDKTSSSPPKYLQSLEEEIRRLTVCLEEKDRRIRALEEKDLAQQNEVSELRSALHQMEQLLSDRTGEVQELKHQVLLEKQRDKLDAIENLFHIWKGIRQGSQQVQEALVKTEREMGQIQALQEAVLEKETAQATREQQLLQALEELGAALGTAEHRRDSPEAALKEEASAKKKVAGIVHQVVESLQRKLKSREEQRQDVLEESHAHCSQQLPELQEQAPTQELSARQDSNNFLLQQEEQCQEGQQNLDKLGEKDKTSSSPPKYLQSLEEEIRRLTVCLEEKDRRIRALEEKDLAQQNEVSELRSALHQMEQLLSDRTGEVQELKHQVLLEKQRDKLDAIENLFHIWKGIRQGSQQVQEALVKTEREMGQIQALQEAVLEKETAQATQEQQLLQALEELGAALGTAEHRRDSPEAALKEEASAKKKVAGIVHQVVESLQRKLKSREEQRQDVLDVGAERKQLSQLSVTNLEQQRVSTSEEENRERRELCAESRRSPEQVQPEERRIKRVFKKVFPPDSIVFYDENNRRLKVPTYGKVSPKTALLARDRQHSQDDLESCAGTSQEPSRSSAVARREPNAAAPEAETDTEAAAASEQ
ncbi:golgin subfamily A member 6-like protein 22 [Pithys albifrons albifrons]|uniref:golgin subfamily A member 6-like protein 22 n=1 Tax=Pithys albifrons albifrons TaxID=3385563 RepID=UPI003A5CE2C8